jgi:hypothetical protein
MASKDLRTETTNQGARHQGKRTVAFVNGQRRSMSATVLSSGTTSGLKLKLPLVSGSGSTVDNVPACSNSVKTNCYIYRD